MQAFGHRHISEFYCLAPIHMSYSWQMTQMVLISYVYAVFQE